MTGKEMIAIVAISGVVDKSLNKAFGAVQKQIDKIPDSSQKALKNLGVLGSGLVVAGKQLARIGGEYQTAMNQLQASTGASAKEMENLGKVTQGVYAANLGEDWNDVANGVALVEKNTGLAGDALQKTTKAAFMLRDVFEYDIQESSRAAKAIIDNFGISGEKAMAYIATGAQRGLDYSNELLDTISEYSVHFDKLGFSVDEMFNIFEQGAENGAWNLDKVGDAIKEFSIRAIDGSTTTMDAYSQLGLNANDMMQQFAAGGDSARAAFNTVADALVDVDDKVKQDAIGVALFGTMWEDLGVDAVTAMTKAQDSAYATKTVLTELKNVKYSDMNSALEGIGRMLEVAVLPLAQALSDQLYKLMESGAFQSFISFLTSNMGTIAKLTGVFVAAWAGFNILKIASDIKTMLINLGLLTAAEGADITMKGIWATVTGAVTTATGALGTAMKALPFGWIIAIIGAVIAIGIALYKNWDTVKQYAIAFANKVKAVFTSMKSAVLNVFRGMKNGIAKIFGTLASVIKAPINAVIRLINKAIGAINSLSIDIPDWVPGIGGGTLGFNIPKIPLLATGGITNGPSIAGEGAYDEYIITPDPRYRSQNLAYWQAAGRALGANEATLSGGSTNSSDIYLSGIEFSPKIEINGQADQDDIVNAIRESYPEFIDMLEKWLAERGDYSYGY